MHFNIDIDNPSIETTNCLYNATIDLTYYHKFKMRKHTTWYDYYMNGHVQNQRTIESEERVLNVEDKQTTKRSNNYIIDLYYLECGYGCDVYIPMTGSAAGGVAT